jgi:hypothetical protein
MVKCSKGEVRRLKKALRWKNIPDKERQRIRMVLLREEGIAPPADRVPFTGAQSYLGELCVAHLPNGARLAITVEED